MEDSTLAMLHYLALLMSVTASNASEVVRTPIEAFRPTSEAHQKRPDRLPLSGHHRSHYHTIKSDVKVLYQTGNSEEDLPFCRPRQVCNKVDLYDSAEPWIERRCRCSGHRPCSNDLSADDNHTLADKTTLFKICEPVKKLPKCRFFRDAAWTLFSFPDSNATQQIVNCHCPRNSVTYLLKKMLYETPSGLHGHQYMFACSPQSRLRCSRKEPCRLFSMRKRHEHIDEVNASTICQCPSKHRCPRHHSDQGVIAGVVYPNEDIRTYNGYCISESPPEEYRFVGEKD